MVQDRWAVAARPPARDDSVPDVPGDHGQLVRVPPADGQGKRDSPQGDRGDPDARGVLCRMAEGLGGVQPGQGGLGGRNGRGGCEGGPPEVDGLPHRRAQRCLFPVLHREELPGTAVGDAPAGVQRHVRAGMSQQLAHPHGGVRRRAGPHLRRRRGALPGVGRRDQGAPSRRHRGDPRRRQALARGRPGQLVLPPGHSRPRRGGRERVARARRRVPVPPIGARVPGQTQHPGSPPKPFIMEPSSAPRLSCIGQT